MSAIETDFAASLLKFLRCKELRNILQRAKLSQTGTKSVLIERISESKLYIRSFNLAELIRICKEANFVVSKKNKPEIVEFLYQRMDKFAPKYYGDLSKRTLFVALSHLTSFYEFHSSVSKRWEISPEKCLMIGGIQPSGLITFDSSEQSNEILSEESELEISEGKIGTLHRIPEIPEILTAIDNKDFYQLRTIFEIVPKIPIEIPDEPEEKRENPFIRSSYERAILLFSGLNKTKKGKMISSFTARIYHVEENGNFLAVVRLNGPFQKMSGKIERNPKKGNLWDVCLQNENTKLQLVYDSNLQTLTNDSKGIRSAKVIENINDPIAFNEASFEKLISSKYVKIDENLAKTIIEERQKSTFISWNGFKNRCKLSENIVSDFKNHNFELTSPHGFYLLAFSRVPFNIHRYPGSRHFIWAKDPPTDMRMHFDNNSFMNDQGLFLGSRVEKETDRNSFFDTAIERNYACDCDSEQKIASETDSYCRHTSKKRKLEDNRVVLDPPSACVGRLVCYAPKGVGWSEVPAFGTATLYDGHSAVTAGHCVPSSYALFFEREYGYDPDETKINEERFKGPLAYEAAMPHYAKKVAVQKMDRAFSSVLNDGYKLEYCETDIGMIFFNTPFVIDSNSQWEFCTDADLVRGTPLRIEGYGCHPPANDRRYGAYALNPWTRHCEWATRCDGLLRNEHPNNSSGYSRFSATYFAVGGHSGSGVFLRDSNNGTEFLTVDGKRQFVGIHSGSHKVQDSPLCVSGPVITPHVEQMLHEWMEEDTTRRMLPRN